MASQEYFALRRRIAELRRHLLPDPFDPTGTYTSEQDDKTRGFVALAHAEIEAFVEDRCLYSVEESARRWAAHRSPNAIVFTLYAMAYTGWAAIDGKQLSLVRVTDEKNVEARVRSAIKQYEQVISGNHGIKEDNLKNLLVPLSIRMKGDIDPAWVAAMSNFGGYRGLVVHTTWKAHQPPNPEDVRDVLAHEILPGLRRLDDRLLALIASVGPPAPRRRLRVKIRDAIASFWRP
jgi:hypothetical protein